ncbi:hypothetical protein DF182_00715 [Chitinophaga flava]|uniref:MukB N-terminal domain-containing protein n=1 Tax=Chitinophaga flava TaxID=2259036 RepID=A0A365XXR9_9BACT|nr:hypothetical protein DF182_00715 [Chitinophaga flava]
MLKHYNQDYLLHSLRTDFTGANGVGKSIIADLFQIVFIGDPKYVKFATEGVDKKKRRVENLPYESGVGYVFFNVELAEGRFIALGAAIFSQGHQPIKTFIITSSINLDKDKLENYTFGKDELLYSNDLLGANGHPYTPDDLARVLPDSHRLYMHYFSSREEKNEYYGWLYMNEILPINLVKEGNLRAFAKVIQSFSKSKALNIDNSYSLIEYLFEEDEVEISQEYNNQEQAIAKLLHQFKLTKGQISDISTKQAVLKRLKQYNTEKDDTGLKLDIARYTEVLHKRKIACNELMKIGKMVASQQQKWTFLKGRTDKYTRLERLAETLANAEYKKLSNLTSLPTLFSCLDDLKEQQQRILGIDTTGLMVQIMPDNVTELLAKDASEYERSIENSREVLMRYATVESMEKTKIKQDTWLRSREREVEAAEKELLQFQYIIEQVEGNNILLNALSTSSGLTKAQQAVAVYLRDVSLSKPQHPKAGMRYTTSKSLLEELEISPDDTNAGWWIKMGSLFEFVPETSELIPGFDFEKINSIDELKQLLNARLVECQQKKYRLQSIANGVLPEGFVEYRYDIDLSDATKLKTHVYAAALCAIVNFKAIDLRNQISEEEEKIKKAKQDFDITLEGMEYDLLRKQLDENYQRLRKRYEKLKSGNNTEKAAIDTLNDNLPLLRQNYEQLSETLRVLNDSHADLHQDFLDKHPGQPVPEPDLNIPWSINLTVLEKAYQDAASTYTNEYNQVVGQFEETKQSRDIRVHEQIRNNAYSFDILEQALLGRKIRTLDDVTGHLETLNAELLSIADDLLGNLVKVFGKTESYFDRYKELVQSLNDFFKGKLISGRFYFQIDFNPAPKMDIKWIEHLRKLSLNLGDVGEFEDVKPDHIIEELYMKYSGNKSRVSLTDLLNPKRYFQLKGKLTDERHRETSGSTGESYTALALLGIARLSVVQDGDRPGLRFIILEESATLDNVNFGLFPEIAKQYGYQIITMTPKPYAVGDDGGWYIHQLIPGKSNQDINYPKIMSYFRTNRMQMDLSSFLKNKN